jgi:senataxin
LSPDYEEELLDYSPEAKIMAEYAPDGRDRNKKLPKGKKNQIQKELDAAYAETPLTAVGTLGSVSSKKYNMNKRVYAFALLDEAAQSPEHETICALVRLDLNAGVCFAGDYNQLPPFSRNHKVKFMVQLSMMERLSHIPDVKHVLLKIQYRMVEVIARWPSKFFYDSQLQTHLALQRERTPPKGFYWPGWPVPMAFVHHETDQEKVGTSVQNVHEVDIIEGSYEQSYL